MSNLVVATNILGLNAYRALKVVSNRNVSTSQKLSSGSRINNAADDAAGLAISEKMRAQIRGLDMASKNAQDGISMIQTAECALAGVCDMIHRIRELTVQGANETNEQSDRDKLAKEIFQLTAEILATEDRIEFNGKKILKTTTGDPGEGEPNRNSIDGAFFQVGPNANQSIKIDLDLTSLPCPYDLEKVSFLYATHSMLNHSGLSLMGLKGLNHVAKTAYNYTGDDEDIGSTSGANYVTNLGKTGLTQTDWISFMTSNVDIAMSNVTTVRSTLGAVQNRLEHAIKSLDIASENLSASESRIRDSDMAKEMIEFTKNNILSQAGMSMLAQANQSSNMILSLLR